MTMHRIIGEYGTYVLTQAEMDKAIDRENNGVQEEVKSEQDYNPNALKATTKQL